MPAYIAYVGTQLALWSFVIALCVNGCRGCKKSLEEREAQAEVQTNYQPVQPDPIPEPPKEARRHRKHKK